MKRSILVLLLLFTLHSFCFSQEEVTVTTIRVWVAVEGSKSLLTEKDFEIFEDGKRMTPSCFEKVQLSEILVDPSVPPNAEDTQENINPELLHGKRIAIFVDQLNTSKPELAFIKPKIKEFLNQIDRKGRIMLAAFPPYEPLVSFTVDANEISTKLDDLDANHERDLTIMERRRQIQLLLEAQRPQQALLKAVEFQQIERQEVQLSLEALKQYSAYLREEGDLEEHTIVLLISSGINSRPGQQYLDIVNSAMGARTDLPLGGEGQGTINFDVRKALQISVGKLNRDNITMYTINTRGQIDVVDNISQGRVSTKDQQAYREDYQNPLDQIARETGGLSFRNSLNFKHGFDAILTDLANQYLLCYVAPEHDDEGEYHKIEVKSKVRGTKLRHRAGYVD